MARGETKLTHILFADDCVLFGRTSLGWKRINNIVEKYEQAYGKSLNKPKTSIFFSLNTKESEKNLIQRKVGVRVSSCNEKYLELPTMVVRSK